MSVDDSGPGGVEGSIQDLAKQRDALLHYADSLEARHSEDHCRLLLTGVEKAVRRFRFGRLAVAWRRWAVHTAIGRHMEQAARSEAERLAEMEAINAKLKQEIAALEKKRRGTVQKLAPLPRGSDQRMRKYVVKMEFTASAAKKLHVSDLKSAFKKRTSEEATYVKFNGDLLDDDAVLQSVGISTEAVLEFGVVVGTSPAADAGAGATPPRKLSTIHMNTPPTSPKAPTLAPAPAPISNGGSSGSSINGRHHPASPNSQSSSTAAVPSRVGGSKAPPPAPPRSPSDKGPSLPNPQSTTESAAAPVAAASPPPPPSTGTASTKPSTTDAASAPAPAPAPTPAPASTPPSSSTPGSSTMGSPVPSLPSQGPFPSPGLSRARTSSPRVSSPLARNARRAGGSPPDPTESTSPPPPPPPPPASGPSPMSGMPPSAATTSKPSPSSASGDATSSSFSPAPADGSRPATDACIRMQFTPMQLSSVKLPLLRQAVKVKLSLTRAPTQIWLNGSELTGDDKVLEELGVPSSADLYVVY